METPLLTVITVLVAAVGYFVKRTFDKTELIGADVSDMKPKLHILWKDMAEVKPKVNSLWRDLSEIKPKVDILWRDKYAPATSPRQLNERGTSILNESGIKEIVEDKKQILLEAVKKVNPSNVYDAEQAILSVVNDLPRICPDIVPQLKDGAFKVGQNIGVLLLVGGFYLRDIIFPELGFSVTDLDKPKRSFI